jgi:hypothetical protein
VPVRSALGAKEMSDKNISPVGWYVGSYLLRFIELEEDGNFDDENRFLSWENTILVKASNLDDAYDKIEHEAKEHTAPYKGGSKGIPVQWVFEGITEITPIYDELEHGTEIMYSESTRKLKNLKKSVRKKGQFHQ